MYHCDRHVNKLIIELAQIMSINHRFLDGYKHKEGRSIKFFMTDPTLNEILYKSNRLHLYHPSTKWNRESTENYLWTFRLFEELCKEYQHRYGKVHSVWDKFRYILNSPPNNIKDGSLTKPNYAFSGLLHCIVDDPVESYRNYYFTKRDKFKMKWSKREVPVWFTDRVDKE